MSARVQGEVYLARDTRLDRIVAIKVLAEELAASAERMERFELEARAVSQLNQPNICTLHDIGHQDGIDFLVMEYLEGEMLADRLQRGALPFDQALTYGIQIADALDGAHRAKIVHRGLKPGNVMLVKPGVKLLDFGLAKLLEADVSPDDSNAPTLPKDLTRERAVLGRPRYMAPEQLEGGKIDARTDIFAFGLVLREMLTGTKAGAEVPELLRCVVAKCLAVDPDERWQSARDLADELRWISSRPESPEVASRTPLPPPLLAHWLQVRPFGSGPAWIRRLRDRPCISESICRQSTKCRAFRTLLHSRSRATARTCCSAPQVPMGPRRSICAR
jgi:serine/threonine protein kinase